MLTTTYKQILDRNTNIAISPVIGWIIINVNTIEQKSNIRYQSKRFMCCVNDAITYHLLLMY